MNLYIALGAVGFCASLVYHSARRRAEVNNVQNFNASSFYDMAMCRLMRNLCTTDASDFNIIYNSNLSTREFKQFRSDQLRAVDEGSYYFMDIYQQRSNRKLLCSNPFTLAIVICKLFRKERFFNLCRDKKRELDFIYRVGKFSPERARSIDSLPEGAATANLGTRRPLTIPS